MRKKTAENSANVELQNKTVNQIKTAKLCDLVLDNRNANKGTDLGGELLETSLNKYGVGRGILVDRNNRIIAGNQTVKKMKALGIENVVIVPTDGKTLVVSQRTDVDIDSKIGRELAIADNRVSQANLNFDVELLKDLEFDFDLELTDLAIDLGSEDPFLLETKSDYDEESDEPEDNSKNSEAAEIDEGDETPTMFQIVAALSESDGRRFAKYKKENGLHTDGETIVQMLNELL
ncbi:ParB N-terminal domain-containing protein [Arachidicoccus terrestris]|uniref:hypothetical protein n=1 Tax=Arachidicoccus terrestris TaxID=2875539 RepID=UPI001CC46DFB|nr:hypothetical protein [Arachidicoccus terrestris]UAY56254.1 hypothetical protein K9M52_04340 [Arachidicoccus terrestris]